MTRPLKNPHNPRASTPPGLQIDTSHGRAEMLPRRQGNREWHTHDTQDTRKTGRRLSNGHVGLYKVQMEKISEPCPDEIQVKLI